MRDLQRFYYDDKADLSISNCPPPLFFSRAAELLRNRSVDKFWIQYVRVYHAHFILIEFPLPDSYLWQDDRAFDKVRTRKFSEKTEYVEGYHQQQCKRKVANFN